jgi:hypothetical protein
MRHGLKNILYKSIVLSKTFVVHLVYKDSPLKSTKPNKSEKAGQKARLKRGPKDHATQGENVIIADIAGVSSNHVSRVRRGTRQNLKIALLTRMLPPKLAHMKSELAKEVEKLIEL